MIFNHFFGQNGIVTSIQRVEHPGASHRAGVVASHSVVPNEGREGVEGQDSEEEDAHNHAVSVHHTQTH